ncbi:MAG: hypothetical protein M3069_08065 [Chloroflexota bacterium]|nr:hypothetical protein [Chloroflexota bacterium]
MFSVAASAADLTAMGLGALLGGMTVTALLALLVVHQLAAAAGGPRSQLLARNSTVAIAPLLVVFVVLVIRHLLPTA